MNTGIFLDSNGSATVNNLNHELDHLRVTRCTLYGIRLSYAASSSVSFIGGSGQTGTCGVLITRPSVIVQNCALSQGSGNLSFGIDSSGGSFVRQNTISYYTYGIFGSTY